VAYSGSNMLGAPAAPKMIWPLGSDGPPAALPAELASEPAAAVLLPLDSLPRSELAQAAMDTARVAAKPAPSHR